MEHSRETHRWGRMPRKDRFKPNFTNTSRIDNRIITKMNGQLQRDVTSGKQKKTTGSYIA
jgi:hypothetical protein